MPSRRLATPCRGGNLNLPLQVTSLPSPSLSFLPEPLHRHPTMPCHACSNQFSPCNVVPVCYSRPTIFMFQPPSTMFLVSSSQLLACPPVSLSHTCLRAEQYEPSLASPTTIAPSCQFTPVLYPALLRISNLTPPPQYDALDPYTVLFSSSPCPSFPVLQFPLPCSSFPYLVPVSPTVFQFPLPIAAMFQLSAHRPM